MKLYRIFSISFFIIALSVPALWAQTSGSSLKGMSLNGSTGLYSIPSGRIGWESSSNLGLDLGYHAIIRDGSATSIPKFSLSFYKLLELSAAFDVQPEGYFSPGRGTDFLGGLKVQLPLEKFTSTAIALGGNFQGLNMENSGAYRYNAGQIYAAFTYQGQFFNMPAETTVVVGKTFRQHQSDWNIDYGMGFDLLLFPKVFNHFAHWITDFSNFSYSVEAFGADAWYRGVLNTGVRLDLSTIPGLGKFKFVIDLLVTDAFDDNRAFSVGVVFGIPVL